MESRSRRSKFKELTATLTKDELVRRLKSISLELANVDQEDHTDDLDTLAASLVTPFILDHKDKDVRAIAACCLADILRIYAPDPPYNEDQLKDIFNLIVKQLKFLENPDNQMYKRAFYLLESLALVKSFNICFDLDAQDIITNLFRLFFSIVSTKHNAKVRNFMIDVMAPVIQEAESLPQDVLEIILSHCLPSEKRANEVAYQLASTLIDKTSSALEPYVQLFFNNALVLEKGTESKLVDHLYDLIYELYNVNRSVLLSVLPQLEFKLKRNEESDRLEVVKLLGRMFADESFELAQQNRPLWLCFLGRYHDISVDVRVEFIERAKSILISNPSLVADIVDHFMERFLDPDERVRQKVVVAVCEAASERIDALPTKLFDALQERMRDKKWIVRKEALTCVAKLYKRLMSGEKLKAATLKKISWAPNRLLHGYFQNTIEDKLCIERIFHGCLIPVTLNDDERMKRLFAMYAGFDEHALCAFEGMIKHRAAINIQFQNLLDAWTHKDRDEKEKMTSSMIIVLATSLPEPFKAQMHLKKFVGMFSDKQLHNALVTCANIENGCEKVMKAMGDVVKKLTIKNPIIDTVKALLDRGCVMLIDSKSLVKLLKLIKETMDGFDVEDEEEEDEMGTSPSKGGKRSTLSGKAKRGLMLIKCLAGVMPAMFKSKECFQQLLLMIKHKEDLVVETSLKVLSCVAEGLENLDKSVSSCFQPVLSKIALEGNAKKAKYAVQSISKMLKDPSNVLDRIFNAIADNISADAPNIKTHLSSAGEIGRLAPEIFERRHKYVIREVIVKEIMVKDQGDLPSSQESDDEWCEPKELSEETRIKMLCIKVMVKWLEGIQSGFQNAATPVCRLLFTLLKNRGDLNSSGKISAHSKSHLRLAAATAFIRLAQIPSIRDVMTLEQYRQVALTIQDSCYEVRQKFSLKLHKALDVLKLPLDYLAIFSLAAVDPAKDRKQQVKQMIARNAQTRREYIKKHSLAQAKPFNILPEYVLPFLIHLLAHHPDFDKDSLKDTKEYLWFFLETIMGPKAENHAFLKKLAENIKQTRDAEEPDNDALNEKIYAVCDLTVWLIMNKTHVVALKDFPGNPVLPKKLFVINSDMKSTNTKVYLPKEFGGLLIGKKRAPPLDLKVQPPLKFQTSTPAVQSGKTATDEKNTTKEPATTPLRAKGESLGTVDGNRSNQACAENVDLSESAEENDITLSPTLTRSVHYADMEGHAPSMTPSSTFESEEDVSEKDEGKENETPRKSRAGRKRPVENSKSSGGPTRGAKTSRGVSPPQESALVQSGSKAKQATRRLSMKTSSPGKTSSATAKGPTTEQKSQGKQTKLTAFAKAAKDSSPKRSPVSKGKRAATTRKGTPTKSAVKSPTKPPGKEASAKSPTKGILKNAGKPTGSPVSGITPGKSPAKNAGKSPVSKSPTKQSVKRKLDDMAPSPVKEAKISKAKSVVIGKKASPQQAQKESTVKVRKQSPQKAQKGSPQKAQKGSPQKSAKVQSPAKQVRFGKSRRFEEDSSGKATSSPSTPKSGASTLTKRSPAKASPKKSPVKAKTGTASPAKSTPGKLNIKRSRAKRR